MTDINGVSYMLAVVARVCYTLQCKYTTGRDGALQPTQRAMTLNLLLALLSLEN